MNARAPYHGFDTAEGRHVEREMMVGGIRQRSEIVKIAWTIMRDNDAANPSDGSSVVRGEGSGRSPE